MDHPLRLLLALLLGLAPAGLYRPPVAGPLVVLTHFNPPAQNWLAGHRGVDLRASRGETVHTPSPGVVTFAGSVAGKPVVSVTHPDGLRSSFEPVVATVAVGDVLALGDRVGTLAQWPDGGSHCPAQPDSACLHWGVRRGRVYLDPLLLLGLAPPIVLLPMGK